MAMTQLTKRLGRIFESILGCQFEYQSSTELSAMNWSALDLGALKANLGDAPQYIQGLNGKMIGFPVFMKGSFAGLAIVDGYSDQSPQKLITLAELLSMVMENGIRQEDRKDRLRLIEERLALLDDNSNVIPLRPARYGRVLQVIDTDMTSEMGPSPVVTNPLLLETNAGFPLSRVAIEVHHLSKRWAFLSIEDLPSEIFNSRESLEELGGLTLFIRDISVLTTPQQMKLADYLGSAPNDDMPHVIAGANQPVAELVAAGKLLPILAQLFTVTDLMTGDKTPEQINSDLIKATLAHILAHTTETHSFGEHVIPFHMQYFGSEEQPNSFH